MDSSLLPNASSDYGFLSLCGCSFIDIDRQCRFLPIQKLSTNVTILNTVATTRLVQVFRNTTDHDLNEVTYSFPLYDGVSVGQFTCTVGEDVISGIVKPQSKAKADYDSAVARGETAALLTQSICASDVFTTSIGNIPSNESVTVELTYFGDLKFDAQIDGMRYVIPTAIAPRYGQDRVLEGDSLMAKTSYHGEARGMSITIDVDLPAAARVQRILSPSHPIDVSIGKLSNRDGDAMSLSKASATLSLGEALLANDFIIQIAAEGFKTPCAMLEDHPSIPGQRALMISAVPDFKLPEIRPEILFVCDRSGSMEGSIGTLKAALEVFLKSLPIGVYFNLVSFGTRYEFLWQQSKEYNEKSLKAALKHVSTFAANFGGTETQDAIGAATRSQSKEMPTEIILLTDGDIWRQQDLFDFIGQSRRESAIRYFCLGIGGGVSSALVGGVVRAGGGFAEYAADGEPMDARLVKLLKGALTPHLDKASLEIRWDDDEYEIVDNISDDLSHVFDNISNDLSSTFESIDVAGGVDSGAQEKTSQHSVPSSMVTVPGTLQSPSHLPPLFASTTFKAYLLLSPRSEAHHPAQVMLRAISDTGPVEIPIPVESVGKGALIHQLAARKAMQELEEGHGWIQDQFQGTKHQGSAQAKKAAEHEAVRLGVTFQVLGKYCSFVAVKSTKACNEATIRKLRSCFEEQWRLRDLNQPPPFRAFNFRDLAISADAEGPREEFSLPSHPAGNDLIESSGMHMQALLGNPSHFDTHDIRTQASLRPAHRKMSLGLPTPGQALGSIIGSAQSKVKSTFLSRKKRASSGNYFSSAAAPSPAPAPAQPSNTSFRMSSAASQPAAPSTGSLFGSSTASSPQTGNTSTSLFGTLSAHSRSPAATSAFGAPTAAAQSGNAPPEYSHSEESEATPSVSVPSRHPLFGGSSLDPQSKDVAKTDLSTQANIPAPHSADEHINKPVFHQLIDALTFEGCWKEANLPQEAMNIDRVQFIEKLKQLEKHWQNVASLSDGFATACALTFLEARLPADLVRWELLANKARAWLARTFADSRVIEELMAEARIVVGGGNRGP